MLDDAKILALQQELSSDPLFRPTKDGADIREPSGAAMLARVHKDWLKERKPGRKPGRPKSAAAKPGARAGSSKRKRDEDAARRQAEDEEEQ